MCLVSSSAKTTNDTLSAMPADVKTLHNPNLYMQKMLNDYVPRQFEANHADFDYIPAVDLLYHRLDLMSHSKSMPICRYFHQTATMGK